MASNFEEMECGINQPDPQSEILVSALKELSTLSQSVFVAEDALKYYALSIDGKRAHDALMRITELRTPKAPGNT